MAHLNEDGLRHLLKKLVSTFGTNDISNSVQKTLEIIVTKDPRGHGVYTGGTCLLSEEHRSNYGGTYPSVTIPFYTKPTHIGSLTFVSSEGTDIPMYMTESDGIMVSTNQDSLGFCPGTLSVQVLDNNNTVVEEVSSDFIINPITLNAEGIDYINSENPSVVGNFNQYIFLNTPDLGYRGQEIGRFAWVSLPANIDYVDGAFFMDCPLNGISIDSGNSRYTSIDPDSGNSLDCILDIQDKRIVVGTSSFQATNYTPAYNNSEEWTLASGAFSRNESVSYILIPSYVKYIESSAFYNCYNLNQVTYQGTWDEFQNACNGDPYVVFQYDEGGRCVSIYTEGDGQYNELCF